MIWAQALWAAIPTHAGPEIVRGPYLQMASPESMVIRWRTDVEIDALLRYGTALTNLAKSSFVDGKRLDHAVRIRGLKPNTRYFYSIGYSTNRTITGGTSDYSFTTPPPAGERKASRVWVLGDSGTGNDVQRSVMNSYYAAHAIKPCDLWLMLGDNAYPSGTDRQFQKNLFDIYAWVLRQKPLWPTIGNHDAYSSDSETMTGVYFDIFTLPAQGQAGGVMSGTKAYYSFDYANIHFVCLDSSDSDRSTNGAMARWLRSDMAATTQDWIVSYFHHPPYTRGGHNSDRVKGGDDRCSDMREIFIPILEQAGADLVLCGHSHDYERSYLLAGHYGNATNLAPSMVLNRGTGRPDVDGAYEKPAGRIPRSGTVYMVAGDGGQTSGGPLNHPAMWLSLNRPGSVILDFDGLEMKAQLIGDKGQLHDYFSIRKH
jgi:hypothetical protein